MTVVEEKSFNLKNVTMSWFLINRNLTPLEPYDWKLSSTVLRGERGSNAPDLPGKAIASPTMAEYIKYLYKTVRKFHGIAGVVTQELNDVIDSPIVKEAIINNSDVKILLDQTKFKDRYEDIAAILGLTDIQRQQIFTINALNNHEGRSYFKEVWICRGQHSDVYGVEEAPECYWAYTTERTEKEALKIYLARYGTLQEAITRIEEDRKADGGLLYLEFARKVNQHQKVMSLW